MNRNDSTSKSKVVCHSPLVVHSKILADNYQRVDKVPVHAPPTVVIQGGLLQCSILKNLRVSKVSRDCNFTCSLDHITCILPFRSTVSFALLFFSRIGKLNVNTILLLH